MKIDYMDSSVGARKCFSQWVRQRLQEGSFRSVCDIGGGRNPLLTLEEVEEGGLDYTLLDIAQEELDRAAPGYRKVRGDVGAPGVEEARYDFVFSRMLAEHVRSGEQFYRNTYCMLKPGGEAMHLYPTLFALPFFVNKLIPEALSDPLLDLISPRDREKQGKFPAHYSWCFGPTPRQIQRLEGVGFEIVRFTGMYNHGYFKRIPPLHRLHQARVRRLLEHPNPYLTSFAIVHLRRKSAP